MSSRVVISDLGPFKRAEIRLKPLTLLIGKNSVGKSFLAYLLWSLTAAEPDIGVLLDEVVKRGSDDLVNSVLGKVNKGESPSNELVSLLKLYIESLPLAIEASLRTLLPRVFMSELKDLIRVNANAGRVEVHGSHAHLIINFKGNDISVEGPGNYMQYLQNIKVDVLKGNVLNIKHGSEEIFRGRITSSYDVYYDVVLKALAHYVVNSFKPLFSTEEFAALLVDSRAGISRTLLKPYVSPRVVKGISYPDEQFMRLYYRLCEMLHDGRVNLEFTKEFLNELGCDLRVDVESGVYVIRVKSWSGKELSLPQAPSGVRESVALALSLSSRDAPYIVIIEEPEAHLHPRAQVVLARLVARSINALGKYVIMTTHSDYLVYSINNLISLSKRRERAGELGLSDEELLDPNKVVAYLIRVSEEAAVTEPLRITDEGIDEGEFVKVAEELVEVRAGI